MEIPTVPTVPTYGGCGCRGVGCTCVYSIVHVYYMESLTRESYSDTYLYFYMRLIIIIITVIIILYFFFPSIQEFYSSTSHLLQYCIRGSRDFRPLSSGYVEITGTSVYTQPIY